ncbi:MAG: DUF3750 domain-containing protein [Pseudomonadota bacterium]
MILRLFRYIFLIVSMFFVLPAAAAIGLWVADDNRPTSWNQANWQSAGILHSPDADSAAVIYLMAARTGRLKGALSVHSWLVYKREGERRYNRFEKVGWGSPLRHNAYAADAKWYSNTPQIVASISGENATKFIPKLEKAIESYPFNKRGDYKILPGPNSNTFIAHVLNAVPELGWVLPSHAVGRDYRAADNWIKLDPDYTNLQITAGGLFGLALGKRHGIEFQFLGLVSGFDFQNPGIKLPGFGTLALANHS